MSSLSAALDRGRSGIVQTHEPADAVAAVAEHHDWRHYAISLSHSVSKAEFLDEVAKELDLPDYFGGTWDSLADCLRDVQHTPGTLLVLAGLEHLRDRDREVLIEVLDDRIDAGEQPFVTVVCR